MNQQPNIYLLISTVSVACVNDLVKEWVATCPLQDVSNSKSLDLNQLGDCGLVSLQLITMEMKVKMLSNEEVEVQATMKDIALCDEQKDSQKKKTGLVPLVWLCADTTEVRFTYHFLIKFVILCSNRVVQHYTSNPIQAYTGIVEHPIVSITYLLRGDQHISELLCVMLFCNYHLCMPIHMHGVCFTVNSEVCVWVLWNYSNLLMCYFQSCWKRKACSF